MKILQVIPYFTPKRGGDVNVVYNISKHLMKRGHEITIITTDFEFDEDYAKSLEGIEVIPFKCLANISMMLFSPAMKKWLKKEIRNFDVIHLHTFRSYQNNLIYYCSKIFGISYVLQAHGSVLPFFAKQKLKNFYDMLWGFKILKEASEVIALNRTEVKQYKKMGVEEEKIDIVQNGIDLSEYENLPKKGEFRKKYSIEKNEKIILYLGRIHWTKGIDMIIRAFNTVLKKFDNVKLILMGPDDGYQHDLQRLIKNLQIEDKVIFTGFVKSNIKTEALVDADVFVTPSFSGFPVTFIEACACGTPIITTVEGDELDWIHNNTGFVVEYDEDQLADAITYLLNDKKLNKIFGENGKNLVKKEFNWDNIVKKVEKIYENCI